MVAVVAFGRIATGLETVGATLKITLIGIR